MKVGEVMTKKPISVSRSHKLRHALHTMAEHNISGCPVTDSRNNVIGIISQTDILDILDVHGKVHKTKDILGFVLSAIKSQGLEKLRKPLRNLLEREVENFMNDEPVTVDVNDDLYDAAKMINRHNVDRLIVVKNRKLVGILTKSDMIKVLDKMEK